jgi:flavin reductase (DIM6/NTAB) family NADH-FMN oxidoreductase RutF
MSLHKKPWNRVSLPVYSISSKTEMNENMHICTYVSAVSMHPKQMMVAIFHGTKTLENITANASFMLQLLAAGQYRLISLLGKQSGNNINKIQRLEKRQLITEWNNFKVLKDALSVIQLQAISHIETGDHRMFLCNVIAFKNLHPGDPLTTKILHEKRIIRI